MGDQGIARIVSLSRLHRRQRESGHPRPLAMNLVARHSVFVSNKSSATPACKTRWLRWRVDTVELAAQKCVYLYEVAELGPFCIGLKHLLVLLTTFASNAFFKLGSCIETIPFAPSFGAGRKLSSHTTS